MPMKAALNPTVNLTHSTPLTRNEFANKIASQNMNTLLNYSCTEEEPAKW